MLKAPNACVHQFKIEVGTELAAGELIIPK